MKKLVKGIVDFRKKSLSDYRDKFSKLAAGQSPDALFVACCDSRVVPNTFASSDPGDLFVLRNIGNLVPPYQETPKDQPGDVSVAATIEFSLKRLNVSDIIICGHSECGAMQSFTTGGLKEDETFVRTWLQYAIPSYERYKKCAHANHHLTPHNQLSQINVLQQIDHLKTYPWVRERVANKTLRLHGWWFELATADVYHYDSEHNDFIVIDGEHAEQILQTL